MIRAVMELTSRELATIIIFVAFVALAVLFLRDRTQLREAAIELLKALSAWKLWSVILAYLLYAAGAIALAYLAGLWSGDLLKETLIVVFFVGHVRLALLLGFRGSLRYATGFTGLWLPRIATETSFTSARQTMRGRRWSMA